MFTLRYFPDNDEFAFATTMDLDDLASKNEWIMKPNDFGTYKAIIFNDSQSLIDGDEDEPYYEFSFWYLSMSIQVKIAYKHLYEFFKSILDVGVQERKGATTLVAFRLANTNYFLPEKMWRQFITTFSSHYTRLSMFSIVAHYRLIEGNFLNEPERYASPIIEASNDHP